MAKAGILGRREDAALFYALGVEAIFAETETQARAAFETILKQQEYGVLFLMEEWFPVLRGQIGACPPEKRPLIVLLPGRRGGAGYAADALDAAVQRAIGMQMT